MYTCVSSFQKSFENYSLRTFNKNVFQLNFDDSYTRILLNARECKRTEHCWPTTRNTAVTCCVHLQLQINRELTIRQGLALRRQTWQRVGWIEYFVFHANFDRYERAHTYTAARKSLAGTLRPRTNCCCSVGLLNSHSRDSTLRRQKNIVQVLVNLVLKGGLGLFVSKCVTF